MKWLSKRIVIDSKVRIFRVVDSYADAVDPSKVSVETSIRCFQMHVQPLRKME